VTADRAKPRWDLDQLADYAAGLLDDARSAELAAVLESDPAAAQLYAALGHADDLVRAELRELPAITMPADVIARLDAALAAEAAPAVSEVGAVPVVAAPSDETVAARAAVTAIGERERPGAETSQGNVVPLRRRRWLNGAGAVAAGVAVLAGAAVGLNHLNAANPQRDSSTAAAGSAPRNAPQNTKSGFVAGAEAGHGKSGGIGSRLTASGTDYRQASLATQVRALSRSDLQTYTLTPSSAPSALQRVAAGGLTACLDALGISGDVAGLTVDYARFDGNPALVVAMPAADGIAVTVAGPDCGKDGTADLKLRTTVPSA
jgi:negative regulator of sigma E activity